LDFSDQNLRRFVCYRLFFGRLTPEQLTKLLAENPSLRGMLFGYVAELKLREIVTSIPDCLPRKRTESGCLSFSRPERAGKRGDFQKRVGVEWLS